MSLLFPVHPLFGRGGAAPLNIADLFSTDLYTGNSSTQTITNGIDLSGEGGLVWIKGRSFSVEHILIDTERGATNYLSSDRTSAEATNSGTLTSFNSSGFDIGSSSFVNTSPRTHAAWTFRRSPRFFDVVTYTGDTTGNRTFNHNLGVAPGMVVIKERGRAGTDWHVYHVARGTGKFLYLNLTNAESGFSIITAADASTVTVSGPNGMNSAPNTYVMYLFAHDTASDGVIQCGSYTGNGSTSGPTITLGWEPQWVMIKRTDNASDWRIYDNERSPTNPRSKNVWANLANAENDSSVYNLDFLSTGFQPVNTNAEINASGGTYIYMAIRAEGA